jgi:DnaJ-domain-containing protein 1
MFDSSEKITKQKITVEVEVEGGKTLVGYMFLKPQGRLTDMMNDERIFLPFETTDGKFFVLKKTACISVAPIASEADAYVGNNPFQILGVSANASLAEIKQRYHALCAENHPDRLGSMGLPREFIDLATTRMSRINDAWTRIQKQVQEQNQAAGTGASAA